MVKNKTKGKIELGFV